MYRSRTHEREIIYKKEQDHYAYTAPALLVFAVFLFYPFFKTIYLSLFKTNKMGQAKLFVGLGNYMELFQSESFYNSLAVTLLFVAIVVAGSMALGLLAAVLCNKAFPGNPYIQHGLCAAHGHCVQFRSHDI